jgi:O-antigen/teichoic acid export membrane protein
MFYVVMIATVLWFTGYPQHTKRVILLLGIGMIPEGLNRLAQALLIAHERFGDLARISLVVSGLELSLSGAALWANARLEVVVLAQVLAALLGLAIYAAVIRSRHYISSQELEINWRFIQEQIRRSLPFAAIELCFNIGWQIDVVLLSFFVSEKQVGYFSGAQAFASVALIALSAYHLALYPLMTRLYATDKPRLWSLYRRLLSYAGAICLVGAISVTVASPAIITAMYGPGFRSSAMVLQWLIWSVVVYCWVEPNSRLIIVTGQQKTAALFLGLSMMVNVLANILLIRNFGILGTAWARVLSTAVFALTGGVFVFIRVSHINPLPVTIKLLIAGLAMTGVILELRSLDLWLAIALGGLVFIIVAFVVRLVPVSDQRYLFRLACKRLRGITQRGY